MLDSLDFRNQSALKFNNKVAPTISKICEPLFKNFGLTVFIYSHFLNDGTYLDICTHTEWQKHYLKEFAHKTFVKNYIKKIFDENIRYIIWDNRADNSREEDFSRFITDRCEYNIWHGFSIYKKHFNSLEAWHFASTKDNYEIINFYLNKLDLLYHFILYFSDQAGKIIDVSDPEKLIRLEDRSPLITYPKKEILHEMTSQNFISQTEVKRFSITTRNGVVFISRREAECMRQLRTSKTVKEIAREMQISPRTVESYLNNVKSKLNCSNKLEIINLFERNCTQYFQ